MSILKNLIYTKSFVLDKAQYLLSDSNGNSILLKIDYKNNFFTKEIVKKNRRGYGVLQKEAEKIAKDLLSRKSGTNFAVK